MPRLRLVRIAACMAVSLAVAAFVQLHGLLQANLLRYGYRMRMEAFPLPTTLCFHYSHLGYLLPLSGLLLLWVAHKAGEDGSVKIEVLLKTVYLLVLIWMLGCILSWQLPYYFPVDFIR
jgi:hypothetical protein